MDIKDLYLWFVFLNENGEHNKSMERVSLCMCVCVCAKLQLKWNKGKDTVGFQHVTADP